MKRMIWLMIIAVALVLAVFIFLIFRKSGLPVKIKGGKITVVSSLLNEAKEIEAKGNLVEVKSIYQRLLNEFPGSSEVMNWQKKFEDINIKLLFSPAITLKTELYEIKPGDTLTKIAKDFKTTIDLLKKSNSLATDNLIPGKRIKVWVTPFSILVDKSQNTLILKSDEEIIKTYTVSTGINNSTPVGTFTVVNKLVNPTWYKAGAAVPAGSPENILGTRWFGLSLSGYGIHGTTEPQSLGKQVTQGCVRMANPDVEELYLIVPEGAEVTVVD